MYEYLKFGDTYRNDRTTHSPKVFFDPETGEMIKGIEKKLEDTDRPKLKPLSAEEIREINKIFK
jgi:hypothetical protein